MTSKASKGVGGVWGDVLTCDLYVLPLLSGARNTTVQKVCRVGLAGHVTFIWFPTFVWLHVSPCRGLLHSPLLPELLCLAEYRCCLSPSCARGCLAWLYVYISGSKLEPQEKNKYSVHCSRTSQRPVCRLYGVERPAQYRGIILSSHVEEHCYSYIGVC